MKPASWPDPEVATLCAEVQLAALNAAKKQSSWQMKN